MKDSPKYNLISRSETSILEIFVLEASVSGRESYYSYLEDRTEAWLVSTRPRTVNWSASRLKLLLETGEVTVSLQPGLTRSRQPDQGWEVSVSRDWR